MLTIAIVHSTTEQTSQFGVSIQLNFITQHFLDCIYKSQALAFHHAVTNSSLKDMQYTYIWWGVILPLGTNDWGMIQHRESFIL